MLLTSAPTNGWLVDNNMKTRSDVKFVDRLSRVVNVRFKGYDCRKLLKKVGNLKRLCPEEHFVYSFSSFNEVVTACYALDLHPEYIEKIGNFKKAFMKLNISVTPKVHAVFKDVEEYCSLK